MLRWFDTVHSYDLLHMPDRLYKYYRYNDALNAKRLSGQVYLASPLDFNDPCDCQRKVINNAQTRCEQKGGDWLSILAQIVSEIFTSAAICPPRKSLRSLICYIAAASMPVCTRCAVW